MGLLISASAAPHCGAKHIPPYFRRPTHTSPYFRPTHIPPYFRKPTHIWLTIVQRRKLQWYGHVYHSSGLAKTFLQGTVKGERRQGRQKKRWEGNIREWMGLEFAKSQREVENTEKWRKLVVKSSVVPQWPSWLRERWRHNDHNDTDTTLNYDAIPLLSCYIQSSHFK